MNHLIESKYIALKEQITFIVKDLHDLTADINHKELSHTLSDLRARIDDPFMFVVVGEVKAGKSSFINALLGQDICGVAPQPYTDTIQQISYGEENTEIVNNFFRKIKLPIDVLKDFAIVDTPGTNAIIEHHQELTERFVPSSDLIVFVFEAKNPYRQSSWDFFKFIQKEWRKKIIFVLQQKDLMNVEDLAVNEKGVYDFALKNGIDSPEVFSVSAKQEIEGELDVSGFVALKEYIQHKVTGGKAVKLKIESHINIVRNISDKIRDALIKRIAQYEADKNFREEIESTLSLEKEKSLGKVSILVDNLVAGYDQVCYKTENKIRKELGVMSLLKRSFSSIFSKDKSLKEWFDQLSTSFTEDINLTLQSKLNEGVFDVADSINNMLTKIDHKIQKNDTTSNNNDHYFEDIAQKRTSVLQELKSKFENFIKDTDNFKGNSSFGNNSEVGANIMKGSGIAVVGIILSTVTNIMVLDITGGILSTIGILFAGVSIGWNKSKIIKSFRIETQKGSFELQEKIKEKLDQYIVDLEGKIQNNFSNFDDMLLTESEKIEGLEVKIKDIDHRILTVEKSLV